MIQDQHFLQTERLTKKISGDREFARIICIHAEVIQTILFNLDEYFGALTQEACSHEPPSKLKAMASTPSFFGMRAPQPSQRTFGPTALLKVM